MTAQAVLLIPGSPGATPTPTPTSVVTRTATPTAITTITSTPAPTQTATPVVRYSHCDRDSYNLGHHLCRGGSVDRFEHRGNDGNARSTERRSSPAMSCWLRSSVYDGSGSDVPTPPSGWTAIRHDAVSNGNKITSWLYYKVAGANEPASYGWNISSNFAAGVMGAWRGAAVSPIDSSSGATAAGVSPVSDSAPSLSPSSNNELQLYFYASQSHAGPTIALAGALTQRFDSISSKEGFTLAFADLAAPSAHTASAVYPAVANVSGSLAMTAQAILLVPAIDGHRRRLRPRHLRRRVSHFVGAGALSGLQHRGDDGNRGSTLRRSVRRCPAGADHSL